MEKSRFDIISDLFKLSNVISESLKLAESLVGKSSGSGETDCKDICRNIRYSLKPLPFLLAGIREYVTEHEDKDLARKFVGLHDDTKRLHGICSKYADLDKAAFRTGVAYLSMEVIRQYFFPEKEQEQVSPEGSDISTKPMTRTEATDCIDPIRSAIRKCAKDSDGNRGKEMYAMLAKVDKAKIQAVKEYIVNANDKDLAQLFTEYFAEAVHLSMLPQNDDVKAQSAGIKMFHIAMTMGYVKRNVLHESASKAISPCIEEVSSGFTVTDTMQGGTFSTTAQVPVKAVPFPYHLYRTERLRQRQASIGRQCRFRPGLPPCRHACRLFHDIRQLREGQDALCRHPAVQSLLQGLERLQGIRCPFHGADTRKPRQVQRGENLYNEAQRAASHDKIVT